MKKCAVIAMLAGTVAGAYAQPIDDSTTMTAIEKAAPSAGYNSRDVQLVYNVGPTTAGGDWRARGGAHTSGSRFSFNPGPGATTNPMPITGVGFAFDQDAAGAAADSSLSLKISFYLDPVGGPAINPTALPAVADATITGDFAAFCTPGYITYYPGAPIALTAPLSLGSDTTLPSGFYKIECFSYQTTTLNPSVGPSIRGLVQPNPGSSDGARWADANNDGVFAATEGFGTLANPRVVYLNLNGDVPPPPPPSATEVGCIPDAGASASGTVADGGTTWFHMCLNGDATANARQFLAIDTNGSAAAAAIGVYSATTGALVGVRSGHNEGAGDAGAAQLSYGIGRHNGQGTAQQLSGDQGDILAGEYYVAVSGAGASFGNAYTVTGGPTGGAVTLNFHTNTNGGALPPFASPTIPAGNDLGVLTDPGAPGVDFTLPANGIDWYSFNVCSDIAAPLYLDLSFFATVGIADPQTALFDSNGNLVATSDDSTSTTRPQLSFGDTTERFWDGGVDSFIGQTSPSLAAGTYFLGTGLYAINSTGDRFDLHGTSASSLTYHVNFYTNIDSSTCGSTECAFSTCAADYDLDGGVTGSDIEAFFIDWENSAACADVDQDGGVTGGDVEAFFIVWEAGGC